MPYLDDPIYDLIDAMKAMSRYPDELIHTQCQELRDACNELLKAITQQERVLEIEFPDVPPTGGAIS